MPPTLPLHNTDRRNGSPMSTSIEASIETETEQHPVSTTTDKSTQTYRKPRPRTVQATTQTEPPTRNYKEELAAQIAITAKTKKRHEEDIVQLSKLREQAAKRETELKRLLEERTTKLQGTEKEVVDL